MIDISFSNGGGLAFFERGGAVAALQQTFLFSLASILAKTRGSNQNIQGIGS